MWMNNVDNEKQILKFIKIQKEKFFVWFEILFGFKKVSEIPTFKWYNKSKFYSFCYK